MTQTIEAVVEPNGTVRLLQPVHVTKPTRAVLTLTAEVPPAVPTGERPPPQTQEEALQRMKDSKTPEELFAAYDEALKFEPPLPEGYDFLKALEENRKIPFCPPADWKAWGYEDE